MESDHKDFSLSKARADLQKIEAAIGKPRADDDRLLCIGAAILAQSTFSEHWLSDSLTAVTEARRRLREPLRYFRRCLANKAAKLPDTATRDEQRQAAAELNNKLRQVAIPAELKTWPHELRHNERTQPTAIVESSEKIGRLPAP